MAALAIGRRMRWRLWTTLTEGPQVLVGSSMGGWIALLLARAMPERVCALVGIAAAPDFTEDSMWPGLTDAQRAEIMDKGQTTLPNDYDAPYSLTRRLFEDGRDQLVLRQPPCPCPSPCGCCKAPRMRPWRPLFR